MATNEREIVIATQPQSVSIIEDININQLAGTMAKIGQFQQMIQRTLRQNHDFGVVPGTNKPTMLKPGAEKICMLLGLRSEFEIADATRDFDQGFFQYVVRCRLYRGDMLVTEGLGSCNTKERKYVSQDAYSIDNTVLKMAKKRALVDAALMVGSLSDLFTQDLEDMDLDGGKASDSYARSRQATDRSGTITQKQAKRMFAIAGGNAEIVRQVLSEFGYTNSIDVEKLEYDAVCARIEQLKEQAIDGSEGDAPLGSD